MSKRKLSQQQSLRIKKRQKDYHEDRQNGREGLVICRFSKAVEIEDEAGNRLRCAIRANVDTLVAGDRVIWEPCPPKQGVVISLIPRTSVLARPSRDNSVKPVAANITQLIIVIAPKPEIAWPLLDSYLIMAESLGLQAVILLNKTDLPSPHLQTTLKEVYQPLGYPLLFTNYQDEIGYQRVQKQLNHEVSVFVGQSGVGKSTLIGKLLEDESIATSTLSSLSELGKHTTSNSRYYHLAEGGALIDSPGVREFALGQMDTAATAQGYTEFRRFIPLCKYRNCPHHKTPYCAITEALERGDISQRRYENFLKITGQT